MSKNETHALLSINSIDGTKIGLNIITPDFILPADGPWLIHGLYMLNIWEDQINPNFISATLHMESISGDLIPNPAPALYPITPVYDIASGVFYQANVPLHIFDTNLSAPGKASIRLSWWNHNINDCNIYIMSGILISRQRPLIKPIQWISEVSQSTNSFAEFLVGTINLSEAASHITGFYGYAHRTNYTGNKRGTLVYFRLDSTDFPLQPAFFPAAFAQTPIIAPVNDVNSTPPPSFIPLDIDIPPGSRINIYATAYGNTSATIQTFAYLTYE